MLKVAIEFDRLVSSGQTPQKAVDELMKRPHDCRSFIVMTLKNIDVGKADKVAGLVKIKDLTVGMTIAEDIYSKNMMFLVPKGQEVTFPLLERIRNFWRNGLLAEDRIRVLFGRPDLDVDNKG